MIGDEILEVAIIAIDTAIDIDRKLRILMRENSGDFFDSCILPDLRTTQL